MYLLDTNACIAFLNGTSLSLSQRLRAHEPFQVRISAITKAELLYGARRSARVAENLRVLNRFFKPLICLPFDDLSAEHYGMIRTDLATRGEMIGPNDLLIAATARAYDLTLVTHNVREFSRIVALKLEDWEAG